ncbi:N-acetylneuraminate synthase family protein [Geitlerinema sp. CS-897]|nr:N-acetylneuraminate synthase family protein [Geitlerinema sp. CS-897]
MSQTCSVNIGGITIGDNFPTVVMAEVGTFFNSDITEAERYLRAIANAGAKLFKTEILHNPNVCLKNTSLTTTYKHTEGSTTEDYRALIERKVVPLEDYAKLFTLCRDLGIPFVCSIYDVEGVDFIVEQGGAAIKFARDNMDNIALIRYAAATGLPLIMDAGNLYLSEIARAIETARKFGDGGVILNHHPAANPAPPEIHNLRVIETYKRTFGVPVGLSCHYRGDEILYAAVGAGVNLIEKGVDFNPDRTEQDLVSAAPMNSLSDIIRKVNNCWMALGKIRWEVSEPRNQSSWKGFVARSNIQKGTPLNLNNVGFSFPCKGISVANWDLIVGHHAARDICEGEVINWQDVV